MVEDLALTSLSRWDEVLIEDSEDIVADISKLGFDLVSVGLDLLDLSGVALGLLLLLNGGDDSPRGTSSTDDLNTWMFVGVSIRFEKPLRNNSELFGRLVTLTFL